MPEERNYGYDLLRVIAISLVVCIHSNTECLCRTETSAPGALLMLEATALCVVSVPVFFMLSGALLLHVSEPLSVKDLFAGRIRKQAIPFLVWSLIYVVLRIFYGTADVSFQSFASLLYEPAYAQFWFMYTLLAIYLLLPFLQLLVIRMSKEQFRYLLLIWAVFSVLVPFLSASIDGFSVSPHVDLILCEGYLGYFLLGFWLRRYGKELPKKAAVVLYAAGTLLTAGMVYLEWRHTPNGSAIHTGNTYGNYLKPGAALASAGLFLLLQNGRVSLSERAGKWAARLSERTMGVFYVHMLVLTLLEKTVLKNAGGVWMTALKAAVTIVISFVIASVMERIPFVNTLLLGKSIKKRVNNDT